MVKILFPDVFLLGGDFPNYDGLCAFFPYGRVPIFRLTFVFINLEIIGVILALRMNMGFVRVLITGDVEITISPMRECSAPMVLGKCSISYTDACVLISIEL